MLLSLIQLSGEENGDKDSRIMHKALGVGRKRCDSYVGIAREVAGAGVSGSRQLFTSGGRSHRGHWPVP
jgi:hypothetical protein